MIMGEKTIVEYEKELEREFSCGTIGTHVIK